MKKFNDYLKEQMQNPEFKKEYDNLQPEFDIIRAIVDARTSQNLTQKQLAEKKRVFIRRTLVSWKTVQGIRLSIY